MTKSIWTSDVVSPALTSAPPAVRADVAVIGAGIGGLTTAYLLAREGRSVVVLDAGAIGSGQTERTSAHLASILDDRFFEVEKMLGVEATRTAHASHAAAIDLIEKIVREEAIDCDFARLDAYLFLGPDDAASILDKEIEAAERAGVTEVEKVTAFPAGMSASGPMVRFGNQARFQPMKYLVALAAACEKRGVRIFNGKRVVDARGADPTKEMPCVITFEDDSTATAAHVVVATNTPTPINDWMGIYLKQASYRTYMVGLEIPTGALHDALYWDTVDPYHYVRLHRGLAGPHDVLLVGGEDHKVGQGEPTPERFEQLAAWARTHFPAVGEVVSRWSGQVQEPADGIAFIGRVKQTAGDNVYVITGDSGMGLTHGTLGAILITDLIHARPNAWEKLYDPARKELNLEFVKEAANAAFQYKDLVTSGDVKSADDIPVGGGAIIRSGLKKLAVYKDDAGTVHEMTAICPHLGCVVAWNGVEKSWDCPCHGSRFDCHGKVVMGPAISDLVPVAEAD